MRSKPMTQLITLGELSSDAFQFVSGVCFLATLIPQSRLRPIRSLRIDAAHGLNHSGSLVLGTEQAKH
jgi:hypothetical protein